MRSITNNSHITRVKDYVYPIDITCVVKCGQSVRTYTIINRVAAFIHNGEEPLRLKARSTLIDGRNRY